MLHTGVVGTVAPTPKVEKQLVQVSHGTNASVWDTLHARQSAAQSGQRARAGQAGLTHLATDDGRRSGTRARCTALGRLEESGRCVRVEARCGEQTQRGRSAGDGALGGTGLSL